MAATVVHSVSTTAHKVGRRVRRTVIRAVQRSKPAEEPRAVRATGMVELIGPRQVLGWVHADASQFPIRVSLCINGVEVASTWADDPSDRNATGTVRAFRFALRDIWKYCRRIDRLSVRIDGAPLPIDQKGIYQRPARDGGRTPADLRARLKSGYIFSQVGTLQLSKKSDTHWQRLVLGLYADVSKIVEAEYGYPPFLIYGSLLGYVREQGFIGHDIDFDAAYLSRHKDGPTAAAELRDIGLMLVDRGYDVECKRTTLHIHHPADHRVKIDLFHLYFDDKGELAIPFGYVGPPQITADNWAGIVDGELAGRLVRVPARAEDLVAHLYGGSWRTPNPGFVWTRARKGAALEGRIPAVYAEEVYWANFYAHHEMTSGSTFFDAVNATLGTPPMVLDLGCGDGRDSFAFARIGSRVLGVDRSQVAVRHASAAAAKARLDGSLEFRAADLSDKDDIADVLRRAREFADGRPILHYMRFFLHSVPEDVQQRLLTAIAGHAADGDLLAAEFRTTEDEQSPKIFGGHYRRYQDGPAFGRSLHDDYRFEVLHAEEGRGLAPYKDEDPAIYRVIARR